MFTFGDVFAHALTKQRERDAVRVRPLVTDKLTTPLMVHDDGPSGELAPSPTVVVEDLIDFDDYEAVEGTVFPWYNMLGKFMHFPDPDGEFRHLLDRVIVHLDAWWKAQGSDMHPDVKIDVTACDIDTHNGHKPDRILEATGVSIEAAMICVVDHLWRVVLPDLMHVKVIPLEETCHFGYLVKRLSTLSQDKDWRFDVNCTPNAFTRWDVDNDFAEKRVLCITGPCAATCMVAIQAAVHTSMDLALA